MGTSLSFHKRYIYRTNRLLVTLLTVILLLQYTQQTSCAVIPDSQQMNEDSIRRIRHSGSRNPSPNMFNQSSHVTNSTLNGQPSTDSYFGVFSIKSPCSEQYVRIFLQDISARNDHAAQIEFQKITGTENQFYIKRTNARKYVCISRRGKLVIKKQPTNDHRCAFTQIRTAPSSLSSQSNNLFIKIRSVAHTSWYIGFKTNGYPMKAWQHGIKRDKCFQLEIQKFSSIKENLLEPQSLLNSIHKQHMLEDSQMENR